MRKFCWTLSSLYKITWTEDVRPDKALFSTEMVIDGRLSHVSGKDFRRGHCTCRSLRTGFFSKFVSTNKGHRCGGQWSWSSHCPESWTMKEHWRVQPTLCTLSNTIWLLSQKYCILNAKEIQSGYVVCCKWWYIYKPFVLLVISVG